MYWLSWLSSSSNCLYNASVKKLTVKPTVKNKPSGVFIYILFFGTVYIHFGTVQIVFWDGSGTLVKKVSLEPWLHQFDLDLIIYV